MIKRAVAPTIRLLMTAALTLMANPAWSHARWFIDDSKIQSASFTFDAVYAAILAGAVLFVLTAMCLEHAATRSPKLAALLFERLPIPFDLDWRILSSCLGFVLIATSFTEMVLAPNLKADQSVATHVILAAQAVVGALFLAATRLRTAAALTIALPFASLVAFSPLQIVDYAFEFIGIGLAFWIVAPQLQSDTRTEAAKRPSRLKRKRESIVPTSLSELQTRAARAINAARFHDASRGIDAASILRTMLGIQLIILAAHDKIFEPGVSLAFVEKNAFVNVPALLGATSFTNLHFVFGAGMAEIVFGLLLITNTAARLVAAMLTGLFTLTGLVFGLHEMLGHMPILFSLLVLVTQGGAPDSALAIRPLRTSPALGTALATILLGIVGIAFEPKHVEARITTLDLAPITQSANGLSVPAALYERFRALAKPASLADDAIRDLDTNIQVMLKTATGETRSDKNDLASRLADLAIRYEMAHGADTASSFLRFAVLTAACSQSEIAVFQSRVKAQNWQATIDAVPADLRAVLIPIAEKAAKKVLKSDGPNGEIPWSKLSEQAPTSGPDYVYTHTLACIARILAAASNTNARTTLQTTALD